MDWQQSRVGYYFDLYFSPTLAASAAAFAFNSPSLHPVFIPAMLLGFVAWTFIEYMTHRLLFHWLMRAAHDLHHLRPGAYDAAPPWITVSIHLALLTSLAWLGGISVGLGAFIGLELGYLLYLVTHDRIHHRRQKPFGWLRRRWEHHMLHHQGAEVNFGVALYWWDRVFGTYHDPRVGGRITRKGT